MSQRLSRAFLPVCARIEPPVLLSQKSAVAPETSPRQRDRRRRGWLLTLWCGLFLCGILAEIQADDGVAPTTVEDCAFIADFDGTEQKYVLITPGNGKIAQPVSVLIALHGHGSDRWQFAKQTRDECRATRDVAAKHQLLLVCPDYRATTSWMGPAAEADMLQLIRLLKERFTVGRVIVCGGSMGGTGALTLTALHPEVIDGVVSLNGTANLVKYARFQDAIAASYGGSKQQVPDEYRKRSAVFFPRQFTMPLATTTGGRDDVVPPTSVLKLIRTIRPHNAQVLSIHRSLGGHSTTYSDTTEALKFVISRTVN